MPSVPTRPSPGTASRGTRRIEMCRPKQERSRAHVTLVALLCCLLKLGPLVRRAAFFRDGSVIAPRARGGCAHAATNPTRSGAGVSPTGMARTDDPGLPHRSDRSEAPLSTAGGTRQASIGIGLAGARPSHAVQAVGCRFKPYRGRPEIQELGPDYALPSRQT